MLVSKYRTYGKTVLHRSLDFIIPMYLQVQISDKKKKKGKADSFLGALKPTFSDTRCPIIVVHSEWNSSR